MRTLNFNRLNTGFTLVITTTDTLKSQSADTPIAYVPVKLMVNSKIWLEVKFEPNSSNFKPEFECPENIPKRGS